MVVLMLINGELFHLLNFASFSRWFFIALATLGMLIHRYRFPHHPRPFKVRVSNCAALSSFTVNWPSAAVFADPKVPLVIAVTFTVVCFFIVGLSLYSDPWNTGRSCALTLTGVPVYYVTVYRYRLPQRWRRTFSKSHLLWVNNCNWSSGRNSSFQKSKHKHNQFQTKILRVQNCNLNISPVSCWINKPSVDI